MEVLPLDTGQRSVKEEEWLESLKIFGMSTEDGKTIVNRQVPKEIPGETWGKGHSHVRVPHPL